MFRCLLLILLLFVPCLPLSAQDARAPTWQAGLARVSITPTHLMWMSGYGARDKPAEGRVHDLWAKALVLQDAKGQRCVLVSLDLVGIDRVLAEEICADIGKRTGIPRDGIMLAVSHTHCGPVVGRNLLSMYHQLDDKQRQLIAAYSNDLHGKIVELVAAAQSKLAPAQLSWASGWTTFATNRRNNKEVDVPKMRDLGQLKGPVDHEVPVLTVRDGQGTVKGIVFGYACHATVLSHYLWCGDYPGFAQLALEKKYPEATALFFAGCGADQNPLPRRTVELAEAYGKQLADAVDQVIKAPMPAVAPSLQTSLARIDIPFGELPTREKVMADLDSKDRYIAARARLLFDEFKQKGGAGQDIPLSRADLAARPGSDLDRPGRRSGRRLFAAPQEGAGQGLGGRVRQRRHGLYPLRPRAQGRRLRRSNGDDLLRVTQSLGAGG